MMLTKGTTYSQRPTQGSFQFDVAAAGGPSPGGFTAAVLGTDVDLSALATPGACIIRNYDPSNYVTVGIRDPETNRFYPFLKVGPGQSFPLYLAPDIEEEYQTGTGTLSPAGSNRLHIRANLAPCPVSVEAYEA